LPALMLRAGGPYRAERREMLLFLMGDCASAWRGPQRL